MNTSNIKVSIIVPIYNVEQYLEKLIQSLIDQSYRNIEIILINDGAPDSCGIICDRYAEKDKRIKVIHQKNLGGCAARNAGLDIATGEYIMFVDGDDWLSLDCVEYLLNIALSTNSEMSLSKCHFTTRDMIQTDEKPKMELWTPEETIEAIFRPMFAVGCWNKLYSLNMIRKHNLRFNIPWYGEGLYFCSMAASHANHIGVGNKKVYYYRKNNPTSATTFYKVSNARNALWNSKNIRKNISIWTPKTKWAINQHIRNNYYEAIKILIGAKEVKSNIGFFIQCWFCLVVYTPFVIFEGVYTPSQKWSMLKHTFFPIRYAKKEIKNDLERLQLDTIQ